MKRIGSLGTLLALALSTGCVAETGWEGDAEIELEGQEQALHAPHGTKCRDPLEAIRATLACIEAEDAACAAAGYAPGFVKLHNGVDTNTVISGPDFWAGAFMLVDIGIDENFALQRKKSNQATMRYVETVTTLFGETFLQHEHAVVTVDGDCRMTVWDQYGDNAEQQAVDDAVAEMVAILFPPSP